MANLRNDEVRLVVNPFDPPLKGEAPDEGDIDDALLPWKERWVCAWVVTESSSQKAARIRAPNKYRFKKSVLLHYVVFQIVKNYSFNFFLKFDRGRNLNFPSKSRMYSGSSSSDRFENLL